MSAPAEKTCRWTATADSRLADEVVARLPAQLGREVSRSIARRLVVAGAVRVNGRVDRGPGSPVRRGSAVEARVDVARLPTAAPVVRFDPRRVLYRDEWLLAVDKPPGLPTVPTADPGRPSLVRVVQQWLGGADPYLGVHQRLDRDTSGIVLFTLQPAANAALAAQFEGRLVQKVYLAVAAETPSRPAPDEWTASGPLVARGETAGPDTPHAETAFRVLQRAPGRVLVEARPRTGRKHQIRIHLAAAGLPILGDERHGRAERGRRLMLHARQLAFVHPVSGERVVVECPPPPDFEAAAAPAPPRPGAPRAATPPPRPAATAAAIPRRRGGPPRGGEPAPRARRRR